MDKRWILLFAFLLFSYSAIAAGEEITVAGTGSNEGLVRELAGVFMKENPGTIVNVPKSIGTDGGINGCAEGKFELGRIGRPLKDTEKNLGLTELLFCRMPVVFIVNSNVKVKNLTAEQICDIYAGKIRNWKEVGGKNKRIYVISRDPGEASLIVIQKSLEGFKEITVTDKAIIAHKDYEVTDKVKSKDGTIGYGVSANMKGQNVKILAINNIKMTNAQYNLINTTGLIYKKELSGLAKNFVDFIYSNKGSAVIKNNYCVPLKRQ